MRLEPGNVYLCCICGVGEIEIPEDADLDTLAMMNRGLEEDGVNGGLVCEECGKAHVRAGGKLRIGGIILED